MIRLVNLEQTCVACPSQWEGSTIDGRSVYIRFRHGHLTAGVGPTVDDACRAFVNLASLRVGDEYDGVMSTDQMLARLAHVLEV